MKTQPFREKSQYRNFLVSILTIGLLLLPLIFGNKITISPFVLFAAAVLPNLFWFRPGKINLEGQADVSFKVFLLRVLASAATALVIVIIYRIAYNIAS